MKLNSRQDLKSILTHLPPLTITNTNTLSWPNPQITTTLTTLSNGPSSSRVDSGARFFLALTRIRASLPLPSRDKLAKSTSEGFAKFFDDLLPKEQRLKFFDTVLPFLAGLLLRFPALLERHYVDSDGVLGDGVSTGLRMLDQQQPGFVFLNQELIAALLSCSLFCLYPTANRKAKHLRPMNFDQIFASIHGSYRENQEHKIKCRLNYFERICSSKPSGFVSFERKVLSREHSPTLVTYPSPDFWANSAAPLCQFQVFNSGKIEHHPGVGLEVDFADEYLGGLVMTKGCVQEEIRFMMNPELIAGMLFLPSMLENEAIEIVGAERYSNYTGYSQTFKFAGDHVDRRGVDTRGRRLTRIIAIDALRRAGTRQYQEEFLLREVNKAFCGFLDHPLCTQYHLNRDCCVVTGNWGCGIFGGDPQIKSIIQWISASQALRSYVAYYSFGDQKVRDLEQIVDLIISQTWTVGDLYKNLAAYCSKRVSKDPSAKAGYFSWLLTAMGRQNTGKESIKRKSGPSTDGIKKR